MYVIGQDYLIRTLYTDLIYSLKSRRIVFQVMCVCVTSDYIIYIIITSKYCTDLFTAQLWCALTLYLLLYRVSQICVLSSVLVSGGTL